MEPLFEFLVEVVLQLVAEVLVAAGQRRKGSGESGTVSPWLAGLGCVALGALAGWVSSLVLPTLFLTERATQWANVALTPIAVGWAMAAIGRRRAQKGRHVAPLERFAFAYLFALAMSIARLVSCR